VVEIDATGGPGFGFEHFKSHDLLRECGKARWCSPSTTGRGRAAFAIGFIAPKQNRTGVAASSLEGSTEMLTVKSNTALLA
jgi:hypothetical protein